MATHSGVFAQRIPWTEKPGGLQSMGLQSEVAQSCPTLRNPMDCSLPGSSTHGFFQARVLVWGAIAFSNYLTILQ